MTRIVLIGFLICSIPYLRAQKVVDRSGPDKPPWTGTLPKGQYYTYYSGIGTSPNSLSDAKEQAIANVLSEIIMEGGIKADSRIRTFHEQSNAGIISQVSREIQQTGEAASIEGLRKEEEYWQSVQLPVDGILYQYWILMKIPKPEYAGLRLEIDQGYGFAPVWRSALVPGWGQFYKGEPLKGWRILTTEAACISTTLITYYFSRNYSHKADNERDYERRKFYNDWSNRSYTIGTVSGIVAGVIYSYNIFDAITSAGAKRYAFSQHEPWNMYAVIDEQQVTLNILIPLY